MEEPRALLDFRIVIREVPDYDTGILATAYDSAGVELELENA